MTTPQTKSALTTEVNTNLPDNTTGAITPALLRTTLIDMLSSWIGLVDPANPATGQITYPGTTTNDSAAAGNVGEYVFSQVLIGAQVALTSALVTNVTSISLSAGDWDCSGNIAFNPAAGAVANNMTAWISATSATSPTAPNFGGEIGLQLAFPASTQILPISLIRFSLAVTTTIYLSAFSTFSGGTMGAFGFLRARRMR
jgi:hypothetical protein